MSQETDTDRPQSRATLGLTGPYAIGSLRPYSESLPHLAAKGWIPCCPTEPIPWEGVMEKKRLYKQQAGRDEDKWLSPEMFCPGAAEKVSLASFAGALNSQPRAGGPYSHSLVSSRTQIRASYLRLEVAELSVSSLQVWVSGFRHSLLLCLQLLFNFTPTWECVHSKRNGVLC